MLKSCYGSSTNLPNQSFGKLPTTPWASKAGDGGGRVPRSRKISGGRPPEMMISQYLILDTYENFAFSTIFTIKRPKSEETLTFGGRWVWIPMNPLPPKQNFVATPLSNTGTHAALTERPANPLHWGSERSRSWEAVSTFPWRLESESLLLTRKYSTRYLVTLAPPS